MILVDGSISEYEFTSRMSVNDYLTKLDYKVKQDKQKQKEKENDG